MKDLIIGCFTGYDWSTVQYWANSIDICGFKGDRAVLVYDTDSATVDRLKALRFRVYPFDPAEIATGYGYGFGFEENYAHRFQAYYEYLSSLPDIDDYRYVIATDVRDVVFQTDPSPWLFAHLGEKKICASSESLRYQDEPWGNESMLNSYPRLYDRMASRRIWNCGVQAGHIRVMRDFWLQLSMACAAGLEAADQAAYNILLSLLPWSEITLFAMSEDGWACQAGTTAWPDRIERLRPHLLEPEPKWDGTFACTSAGIPHVILHQYDRVPDWYPSVYRRYESVDERTSAIASVGVADGSALSPPPSAAAVKQRKHETRAMRVHLYTQCWNDEFMLPYFFRHYDSLVERYVIFDDGSTDRSLDILKEHPKVELRRFARSDPHSFELSTQALSNQCWKESRGEADWVIVTDMDEHLYHPAMHEYLRSCAIAGATLIPALGFQMVSENVPSDTQPLWKTCLHGAPWAQMMKPSIFNPEEIDEINFLIGRHGAAPVGNVRVPARDEVLLLHYKYLGLEQTHARHRELYKGLRLTDIKNRWGHRYSWSAAEFEKDWKGFLDRAVDIRNVTPESYPVERWWSTHPTVQINPGDGLRSTTVSGRGAAPAWIASGFYSRQDAFSKAALIAATSEHDAAIAPALAVIDAEIGDLEYRGRVSRTPHPHDLSQEDCRVAFSSVERPDLLAELIRVSRDTFGFYTRHFPFAVKHSWVAGKLEPLPAGSRALDFGAGLSPLPLFLANRGVRVECIDNSTLIRELPPKADWNEWGFFDYGRVHPNLAAHNCDVLKFEPGSPVDVIYSTGALAHLLAADRVSALRKFGAWLRPTGTVLLTLALIAGTDFLWNLSSGAEFEPRAQHGTVDDLLRELLALDFRVADYRLVRKVHKSLSDFALIACSR